MANYQRPGVYVNEVLTVANPSGGQTADAVAAFLGDANRGPTTPTFVDSWSRYSALFGDFTNSTYLAQAVYAFFQNGGAQAYVARVGTASQVSASRTLNDTNGSPAATLRINALSPGAWGNNVYIDVTSGSSTGRFGINVYYGGTASTNLVETWSDMSMTPTDPRYAPASINGSSLYITVADQFSTTAAPNNAPAVQTGTALTSGVDGSAASASEYQACASSFSGLGAVLVMNAPGMADATTLNNLISVANTAGTTFLVVDPPSGSSVSGVLSFASSLTPTSQAAVYYPWINVNDPSKYTPRSQILVPPGGAVVGQFLANDAASGPFQTPAGVRAQIRGAVSLERTLTSSDYDSLNSASAPVCAIKPLAGYGICIFGGRTLLNGYPSRFIAIRRSLMFIEQTLKNLTRFAVFEPNDYRLWVSLTQTCSGFLNDYYAKGGLAGTTVADSFYVLCDDSNNTPASIQSGIVNVEVGVALEYPAEFVVIRIGQFESGATSSNSLSQ